jgi:hypothetical protein
MGQLDFIKFWRPEQTSTLPEATVHNPLTNYEQRPSNTYASPQHLMGNEWQMGPFTPAGVWEVNGLEFLQGRFIWPSSNTQIVTVPDRPIDQGTYEEILAMSKPSRPSISAVYLQPRAIGTDKSVSGSAPTTGIYTGYYGTGGEYEGGC